MGKYIKFLAVFLFLSTSLLCFSQQTNSITGTVVNAADKKTIANASVFIRGTSRGTISGADGSFALHNINPGSYELIVSSIGYATVVYPFTAAQLPLNITIGLSQKATELDAVTVEPFDEETWAKWGQFFLENFIGTSEAARDTRIVNYKTIRFRYYKKKKVLTAIADEPLIIENKALGYRIKYQLEDFSWNSKEQSIVYLGYELFEDMAQDRKRTPKRWIDNRRKAYLGSLVHFMRSLYTNKLAEEKFTVRRLVKQRNLEKDRIRELYAMQAKRSVISGGVTVIRPGLSPNADTAAYYEKVMRQQDYFDIFSPTILTADSVITIRSDSARILFFPDYLYVTYTGAKEEKAFLERNLLSRKPWYPISSIFLPSGSPVAVEKNGLYYPAQEIFTVGYWAWSEKIAHLLPLDYEDVQ